MSTHRGQKEHEDAKREGKIVVGDIVVFRHHPARCRRCGHVFEQGPCCGGLMNCPKCGTRVIEPLNSADASPEPTKARPGREEKP